MYPRIIIDRDKILANAAELIKRTQPHGIEITAVVKALAGREELINDLAQLGFARIGDSSLRHIEAYRKVKAEKWLLRMPMLSEIEQLLELTDGALISELLTLRLISQAAVRKNKTYKVIIMAELGDLREGCEEEELFSLAATANILPHIELVGLGTNLSCYGNILPDDENMTQLVMWAAEIEQQIGKPLPLLSGGNSSSLRMLEQGILPPAINDLRLGESLLLGMLPCYDEPIPWLQQETFIVESQIVELKTKPSAPWGESGCCDSFGGTSHPWQDKGLRKRALIALGKQDLYIKGLKPTDNGIELLGGSSNYLVCDLSDSTNSYQVGDTLSFICDYAAMSTAMTSADIEKTYK